MAAAVWGRQPRVRDKQLVWGQSPHTPETLYWSRIAFSLSLVWGLFFFRGRGLDPTLLKFETLLFDCCLTREAERQ